MSVTNVAVPEGPPRPRGRPVQYPDAMRVLNDILGDGKWHLLSQFYCAVAEQLPVRVISRMGSLYNISRRGRDDGQYWNECCRLAAVELIRHHNTVDTKSNLTSKGTFGYLFVRPVDKTRAGKGAKGTDHKVKMRYTFPV